jgi:hypothetical protein
MSRLSKSLGGFGILGLLLLVASGAAHAGTITFNFNLCGTTVNTGNPGSCSTTSTFTSNTGGFTIAATAEGTPVTGGTNNLWAKDNTGDEVGLGLTSDTTGEDEITPGFFIQLNITSILGKGPFTILMDSTTSPDVWSIYETNTAGSMTGGSTVLSGSDELTHNISATDTYLDFTATTGNVLLSSLSFTTAATPEPSSLVLLGSGILGLAGAVRRKQKV